MGDVHYCMIIGDDPMEELASFQEFQETYIILNVLPITDEQAKKYDGVLKGM